MTKPYIPQPGTIPARAIAHFKTLPEGAELSSAELAEALEIDNTVAAFLAVPRKHGALRCRFGTDSKRLAYWSLGDGTPLPLPHDYEVDEPLHPAPDAPLPPKASSQKPQLFRAGLFTDGALRIELSGVVLNLNGDQAGQLRQLLAGMGTA